jgi:hypothetical protein
MMEGSEPWIWVRDPGLDLRAATWNLLDSGRLLSTSPDPPPHYHGIKESVKRKLEQKKQYRDRLGERERKKPTCPLLQVHVKHHSRCSVVSLG